MIPVFSLSSRIVYPHSTLAGHCLFDASSGIEPEPCSDTRSVLIPRPSARRVSAFTAFKKSFYRERKNIFRTSEKDAAWHTL